MAGYLTPPADRYPDIARGAPVFVALDDPHEFVTTVQSVIDTIRARAAEWA